MKYGLAIFVSVVGRILLSAIFLMSAVGNKIPEFKETVEFMTVHQVPLPTISLAGAIAFLVLGSLSVILGYKTRGGVRAVGDLPDISDVFLSQLLDVRAGNPGFSDADDSIHEKSGAGRSNADSDCQWSWPGQH